MNLTEVIKNEYSNHNNLVLFEISNDDNEVAAVKVPSEQFVD